MKYAILLVFFCTSIISQAQLNGSYAIGGSLPTFSTLQQACDSLNQVGMAGPVIFNIRDGIYNESVTLNPVTGSSATNTITFQSESGDSALVYIASSSGITFYSSANFLRFNNLSMFNSTSNSVAQLDLITDFSFYGCRIYSDLGTAAPALQINSSTVDISRFDLINSSITSNSGACQLMGGSIVENVLIHNSYLNSNSYGLFVNSNSGVLSDFVMTNTTIVSNTAPGFFTSGANSLSNITLDSCTINSTVPGVYLQVSDTLRFVDIRNSTIFSANAPAVNITGFQNGGNFNLLNNTLSSNTAPPFIIGTPNILDTVNILNNSITTISTAPCFQGGFLQLRNLNVSNNQFNGGQGINLYSSGGKYENFKIRDNTFGINSNSPAIYLYADTLSNATISHNNIDTIAGNPYLCCGILLNGNHNLDIVADSNSIRNFGSVGISINAGKNLIFRNNNLTTSSANSVVAFTFSNVEDSVVILSENQIHIDQGIGIQINGNALTAGSQILIANNFMSNCAPCITTNNINNPVDIVHNSIITNGNSAIISLYSSNPGAYNILNNIINVDSLNFTSTIYSVNNNGLINQLNNNVYNLDTLQSYLLAGGSPGYHSIYALNLNTGLESTSFYKSVSFVNSPSDLHVNCTETELNAGDPTSIIADIDGTIRSSVPTIGADELLSNQNVLEIVSANICGDSVVLETEFSPLSTYSWNTGETGPVIIVNSAGEYVVTVTTPCEILMDTVWVDYSTVTTAAAGVIQTLQTSQFTNTSSNAIGYLWDFGDGNTSTQINPTHLYASLGTFTVTFIAYGDCINDTLVFQVFPYNDASINESTINYSFTTFPNPTTGLFTIKLNDIKVNQIEINILNVQGRILQNKYFENNQVEHEFPMNIASFPSGVYFIQMRADDHLFSCRILKQ